MRVRAAPTACASYGDWVALSDTCDADVANLLLVEVSDGIIAPGYTDESARNLKGESARAATMSSRSPLAYEPKAIEQRDVFGVTFEQGHNN